MDRAVGRSQCFSRGEPSRYLAPSGGRLGEAFFATLGEKGYAFCKAALAARYGVRVKRRFM